MHLKQEASNTSLTNVSDGETFFDPARMYQSGHHPTRLDIWSSLTPPEGHSRNGAFNWRLVRLGLPEMTPASADNVLDVVPEEHSSLPASHGKVERGKMRAVDITPVAIAQKWRWLRMGWL